MSEDWNICGCEDGFGEGVVFGVLEFVRRNIAIFVAEHCELFETSLYKFRVLWMTLASLRKGKEKGKFF